MTKKVADLNLEISTVEKNDGLRTKVQIRFLKKENRLFFNDLWHLQQDILK